MRWSVTIALALCTSVADADYRVWSGWTSLVDRLGIDEIPTGADVIVGQVEVPDGNGNYAPDGNNAEFDDKYLIRRSGGAAGASSHATMVGKRFYGLNSSIAPGIWFINCYEVNNWLQSGFLNVGSGASVQPEPILGAQKIWNHSWVGSFNNPTLDNDALRRVDWTIERDDSLVVVGVNNGQSPQPLLAYAFNTISVGRRDGDHAASTVPADFDGEGRMKPEIVGPFGLTSECAPLVAGAAAVLVETARSDATIPEEGEAAETIKAILLAGAAHEGPDGTVGTWSNNAPQTGPDRGRTERPLDEIVGAGHVNIDRAHQILTGGSASGGSSFESAGPASEHGWHLDNLDAGDERWWQFSLPDGADELSVVVTWNRSVNSGFTGYALADFNLDLHQLVDGVAVPLIGDETAFGGGNVASESAVDNLEHLWVTDLLPGTWLLRATRVDGGTTGVDLAAAWWSSDSTGSTPGDLNGDGSVGVDDLLQLLAAWGPCDSCIEDLNGDGVIGVDDLLYMLSLWS